MQNTEQIRYMGAQVCTCILIDELYNGSEDTLWYAFLLANKGRTPAKQLNTSVI